MRLFSHVRFLFSPRVSYRRTLIAILVAILSGSCISSTKYLTVSPHHEQIKRLLLSVDGMDFPLSGQPVVDYVYWENSYSPLWTESNRITTRGIELISLLSNSEQYGLFPSDFHLHEIAALNPDSLSLEDSAELDIQLTDRFFLLVQQLRHGTLDAASMSTHRFTVADTVMIADLRRYLANPGPRDRLAGIEPDHFIYRDFKTELRYLLTKRDSFPHNQEIRTSIDDLYVNIERWRWENQKFPDRHLFLNIASGWLYLVDQGQPVFCTEIPTGNRFHPLRQSDAMAECLVLRETGDVSITIAAEIQPACDPRLWATSSRKKSTEQTGMSSAWVQQSLQITNGTVLASLLHRHHTPQANKEMILERPIPLFIRYYTFDQGKRYPDIHNMHELLIEAIKNPPFSLDPEISTAPAFPVSVDQ